MQICCMTKYGFLLKLYIIHRKTIVTLIFLTASKKSVSQGELVALTLAKQLRLELELTYFKLKMVPPFMKDILVHYGRI